MATEAPTPPKSSKKKKIILIVVIVTVILALIGAGLFVVYNIQKDRKETAGLAGYQSTEHGQSNTEAPPAPVAATPGARAPGAAPMFTDAEVFTSNLADNDAFYFIQVGVIFELTDKSSIDPVLKPVMPIVRSQVLLLLGSKNEAELRTVEGKRLLADQILEIARRAVGVNYRDGIIAVHFTNFVIQ